MPIGHGMGGCMHVGHGIGFVRFCEGFAQNLNKYFRNRESLSIF